MDTGLGVLRTLFPRPPHDFTAFHHGSALGCVDRLGTRNSLPGLHTPCTSVPKKRDARLIVLAFFSDARAPRVQMPAEQAYRGAEQGRLRMDVTMHARWLSAPDHPATPKQISANIFLTPALNRQSPRLSVVAGPPGSSPPGPPNIVQFTQAVEAVHPMP